MASTQIWIYFVCLACSLILNVLLLRNNNVYLGSLKELSWTRRAAEEAEAVGAISCSGHGRAYVDGVLENGQPVCECNSCFTGPDCSQPIPGCDVGANSGDPLFLEPYWMRHAAGSAVVVSGWHRMGNTDRPVMSRELERHIRILHALVGNVYTEGKFILFGTGSTQLLNAAVHAFSPDNSSDPAKVVASIPFDPVYQQQTDFFKSKNFQFQGDASMWKNTRNETFIEFVNSPSNPDGQLKKAVLQGPQVKTIHDHGYYWPHFTPIPAPADEDVMIFSLSKLTGHAGSRFGWALIKDEAVYKKMSTYVTMNTLGISEDTQLRAFQLLKVAREGRGRQLFDFGYTTMKQRWERLSYALSTSKRFSIQEIEPLYCSYYKTFKDPSPAYAWLKCEREEDKECYTILKDAGIIGVDGPSFGAGTGFVRLSLINSQDDFNMLLYKIKKLVAKEDDKDARNTM